MATVSFNIPDASVPRVVEAFCATFGWVDEATSGTQIAFTRQQVMNYVKQITLDYERRQSEAAALASATPPIVVNVT